MSSVAFGRCEMEKLFHSTIKTHKGDCYYEYNYKNSSTPLEDLQSFYNLYKDCKERINISLEEVLQQAQEFMSGKSKEFCYWVFDNAPVYFEINKGNFELVDGMTPSNYAMYCALVCD